MAEGRFRLQRRVYVGTLLVVGAVAAGWFWAERRVRGVGETVPEPQPFVRVGTASAGGTESILRERAEFFDPAPLFVPTDKNYGGGELPARLAKQPGEVFGDFEAKLNFGDGELGTYGAEAFAAGEGIVEALARSNEVPFAGFGEVAVTRAKLPARSALMRISKLGGSELQERVLSEIGLPRADFAPVEFIIAVGPAGLVGDPLLAAGSGREEIDTFFQDFLARAAQVGSLLGPGRYRVTIGP